ncbi:hypothetical protein EMCG_06477 [[Emmonsia] crescens]|uniref:Uncharacterized protein n=1 Tax=[Emmonsia] crescens TaxID=73230 RepID=A0A0G2IBF0_9EURO|nr:hypothetical protein EMCG_06477 [Emmonsia crescens UAMH 3008]
MDNGQWMVGSQPAYRQIPRGYLGSKVAQLPDKSEAGNQWNWRPGYRVLGTGDWRLEKWRDKEQNLK